MRSVSGCSADGLCSGKQQGELADIADPAFTAPVWGEDEEHGALGVALHLLAGGLVDEAHPAVAPLAVLVVVASDVPHLAGAFTGIPFCAGVLGDQHDGADAPPLLLDGLLHPGTDIGVGRIEPGPG